MPWYAARHRILIAKPRCQHLSISNSCFAKVEISSNLGTMALGGSPR